VKHVPNLLTLLRLILVPCFLGASMQRMYVLAFVLFVTAAVTDILDGMLARRFNVRSRLGAILDPAADKTLMVCGFIYYTFAKVPVIGIPGWMTFAVFIRDALIAIFAYLMYTRVQIKRFPPSAAGKTSTVLQAITLAAVIAANGFEPRLAPLADLMFRVSIVVTLYAGWGYMRRAAEMLDDSSAVRA